MAFKPKVQVPEESNEIDDDGELIDEGAEALERALSRVKAQLGETAEVDNKVFVFRQIPDSNELARVWQGDVDSYDLDNIAKKFGSGKYMTKMYATNAMGRMSIAYQKTMYVQLEPGQDAAIAMKMSGNASSQQNQLDPASLINAIVSAIKTAMPPPTATPDPMQQLKGLADVVAVMGGNRQETAHPVQIDPFAMMRNTIELMQMMKSEKEPLEGGTNATGMDVFLRMIDKFGPAIVDTVASKAGQMPTMGQLQHSPAQLESNEMPSESLTPKAQQITTQPQQDDAAMKLKMGLSFLCMQAAAGNDPYTYAAMTLDNVPADALQQFINHPEYLDYLAQFHPEVKQHAEWFAKLREEIIEELKAEAGEEAQGQSPLVPT